ncbi:MAG TPA: glucosylceramidase [Clostridiales bacterium]|nr:glucosylceramidase [Clostridiales bacterium]
MELRCITSNNQKVLNEARYTFYQDTKNTEFQLLCVFPQFKYQEILGFGGAITEACAATLNKMPESVRQEIIQLYFGKEGNQYNICRTHINSCDFALSNYCYIEDGDTSLETFSIERDKKTILPYIKTAKDVSGGRLIVMASPWSPPGFMKTTGTMNHGGQLLPQYYQLWADYLVKVIKCFKDEGVEVSLLSVQNEPNAVQRWDSCTYTAEQERDFIKNYLGPALKRSGLSEIKLLVWDHNKERCFERADTILSDSEAASFVSGVAVHWYTGDHFEQLSLIKERYPDALLVFSEGCLEHGVKQDQVMAAEKYAHDIIGNLAHGLAAFIDWNIVLNENGGPNHAENFCDAPVICNTKEGTYEVKLPYYYLGHFSRFIPRGSRRIAVSSYTDKLEVVGFETPEAERVLVVLNRTDASVPYIIRENGMLCEIMIEPHSIQSAIYKI